MEAPRPGAPPVKALGPTLWVLSPGDGIPVMIGEGPHEFLTLPTLPEEISARARTLVRIAKLERSICRREGETARQLTRLRGLAESMATHLAPAVRDLNGRLSALEEESGRSARGAGDETIGEARESAAQLIRRIDEAIEAVRAELGLALETALARVDLGAILQAIQEWAIPRLRSKDQEILVHMAPDSPHVCGDPERLVQALRHIVENAHCHSAPGAQIEIGIEPDPSMLGFVRLSVVDRRPEAASPSIGEAPAREGREESSPDVGLTLIEAIASASGGSFQISTAADRSRLAQLRIPIWGTRAAQVAGVQSILSSTRVDGTYWVCRSTRPSAGTGNRRCAASILLSPGEMLKVVDDPIPGWERLGRVMDLRERGSLQRALQPWARIERIEARRAKAA